MKLAAFDPRPHRIAAPARRDAAPPSSARAQLLGAIGAAALLRGRKHGRRGALPRAQRPTLIIRDYERALLALLERARPHVERLKQEATTLVTIIRARRGDAAGDPPGRDPDVHRLIEETRRQMSGAIGPGDVERLAARYADQTQDFQREQLGRQIHAAFGADVTFRDPGLAGMIGGFARDNAGLITSIPTNFATEVEGLVQQAVFAPRLHPALARDIDRRFSVGQSRARLIARDQISKLVGNVNHARQRELGVSRFTWRTVEDDRVRDEHDALDGEVFDYDDPPDEGLPSEAVNCFPGETIVASAAPVVKAYRRWYRGEGTVITTADGRRLTSTPNHPMLTQRGWLPAHLVQVDDHVIEASSQGVEMAIPNGERRDPTIAEVFDALAPLGRTARRGLRGWFHGDGTLDEQVDVVDVDRCLRLERDLHLSQTFCEQLLARSDDLRASAGGLDLLFGASHPAAHGVVRRGGQLLAIFLGRLAHSDEHCARAIARLRAIADDLRADGCARDAEVLRDALDAPPVGVELRNHVARVIYGVVRRTMVDVARRDALGAEELAQAVAIDVERSRDLGDRVGEQQYLRVVENVRCELACHVYNLSTGVEWYAAGGIIAHNCRCSAEPVLDDLLGDDEEEGAAEGGEEPPTPDDDEGDDFDPMSIVQQMAPGFAELLAPAAEIGEATELGAAPELASEEGAGALAAPEVPAGFDLTLEADGSSVFDANPEIVRGVPTLDEARSRAYRKVAYVIRPSELARHEVYGIDTGGAKPTDARTASILKAWRQGHNVPAVEIDVDPRGRYFVADGNHRVWAATFDDDREIVARFRPSALEAHTMDPMTQGLHEALGTNNIR